MLGFSGCSLLHAGCSGEGPWGGDIALSTLVLGCLSVARNRDPYRSSLVMRVVVGTQEQRGRQESQVNTGTAIQPDPEEPGMEFSL